jgi:TRAP-type mannitol/chloroaromatic compound transport system substrate-binding protein
MEKKRSRKIGFLVIVLTTLIMSTALAAEQPIKWKAQAFWAAAELPYKTFVDFCNRVKILTNGRLEITPYPGGAIVPSFEALDALQNNVIQAMHMAPVYYTGKEPGLSPLGDLIAAYTHPWQKDAWMYYMGGWDMLNEIYKQYNAYTVGWMFWGVESLISTKPLRGIEDFKGLKIRVPHGMTAMLMKKLGASVVVLPGGEVYSALDKGVIDAADWGTPSMNQRMGFFKVAKYYIYPGFHSMPIGDFTVNLNEWKKLPDDIKQILKSAAREWCWDSYERVALDDLRAVEEMKKKGVVAIAWSEEELAKVRAIAREVWDEYAQKSPMAKKIIDSQKEWLKKLGLIK